MDKSLQAGDVFLTRSTSFLGKLIRICTQSFGEKRSKVNHVGLIVEAGGMQEAVAIEALIRVRRHRLWSRYHPPKTDWIAIYRPKNIPPEDMTVILAEAEDQVGKPYGFGKIIAHFLDWLLFGAYVFRRLTQDGDYPICSWLVAHAFSKAGYTFGVDPGAADPDDIWDFVVGNPGYYDRIAKLGPLTRFLQPRQPEPNECRSD
jgi:hypothetical protein